MSVRLLVWFLVAALAPLTGVGAISYQLAKVSLRRAVTASLSTRVEDKAEFINERFTHLFVDLAAQANSENNTRFLAWLEGTLAASGQDVRDFVRSQDWSRIVERRAGELARFIASYDYRNAMLIDGDGNVLFTVKDDRLLGSNIFSDPLKESLLSKACWRSLKTEQAAFADLDRYHVLGGDIVCFLTHVVRSDDGETLGLMALEASYDSIYEALGAGAALTYGSRVYVVSYVPELGQAKLLSSVAFDERKMSALAAVPAPANHADNFGRIVNTEQTRHWIRQYNAHTGRFMESGETAFLYDGPGGDRVLGIRKPVFIKGVNWCVISEAPESIAFAAVAKLREAAAKLLLSTAVFVAMMAIITTRRIVQPIVNLSHAARRVAEGQLDQRVETDGDDEVGDLSRSFNQMVGNLSKTFGELTTLKAVLDEHAIISITDVKGNITHVNETFCKMSHYTPEELIGKNHRMLKSGEHSKEFYHNLWKTIASGRVWSGEMKNRAKDGSYYWVDATIAPFLDAAGKITKYVAVRTDITERKRAEGELRDRLDELREAAELQEQENWFKTGQRELADAMRGDLQVGPFAQNVLTYLVEYIGAQVGAFYVPSGPRILKRVGSYAYKSRDEAGADEVKFGEGLVGQAAVSKEYALVSDVPEDYIAIGSSLGEASPRNILVWPIVREGTIKAVIEIASLSPFEDRCIELLRQVSENIGIALNVAVARARLQDLLEQSRAQSEELQAKTTALQRREDELKASNQDLVEKTAKLQASEESLQRQSQQLQATNAELEEKTETLERQKDLLESAKRGMEEKAEELALASKYKSEFLANMSHELRTPLNSLLILAKSLSDNAQGNLTADQVESINVIYDGGRSLLALINDILDLSKVESGKMEAHIESFSIESLMARLRSQFLPVAEKKSLSFNIEISDGLPEALASDEQKVEQILRNLLSNAFKFTKSGSVTIRASRIEDEAIFEDDDEIGDSAIAFSVVDTGIGIPEEKWDTVFESFQQADGSTSRSYGGTGLGLAISREFAKLLGGKLKLQSRPGEGSAFSFALPIEAPEPAIVRAGEEEERADAEDVGGEGDDDENSVPDAGVEEDRVIDDRDQLGPDDRVVLIVESDDRLAATLMDMCRQKSFKCLHAGVGSEALAMVSKYKPSAVLLDSNLSDIDGSAVLEKLKSDLATRHIPVHILAGDDIDKTFLAKGARGILNKPVGDEEVLAALDNVERLLETTRRQLLIVEDDESTRRSMVRYLQFQGVEIAEASGVGEAYEKLLSGAFDCLVLDLGLKDGTGFDLLERLKEESIPTPPVIVHTGVELDEDVISGLGLSGCSVVRKGGGSMDVVADKASLFLHSLESDLPEERRKAIRKLHDPAERLKQKRILVVDDDMRNAFALSKILGQAGMRVILAENGQLAIEVLEREEEIDLIVMDVMMPVMDGYEAIRRIRENSQRADVPIIAVTANAMPGDREKCIEAGANDYLTKPVDADKLISMMSVWICES